MEAVFVDATESLGAVADRLSPSCRFDLRVNRQPHITPPELPGVIGNARVALIDHTGFPLEVARQCPELRHIIFLGTGTRSYMNPEALLPLGITVHSISGYGDTAVAEMTVALMWAAAKSLAGMDRGIRAGAWPRTDGLQLTGKTLGLVGFGNIAQQVAGLVSYMRVLAWNRTPKKHPGVEFVGIEELLRESEVVSMHLLLCDETRSFLSVERMALMRRGAILVNTARGALVDEAGMIANLRSGALRHAALDVFQQEPLPPGHALTSLDNVTLSAHSAFRTPEASENLIRSALRILEMIGDETS